MPFSLNAVALYRELRDAEPESDLDFERVLHQVLKEWSAVLFAVSHSFCLLFWYGLI